MEDAAQGRDSLHHFWDLLQWIIIMSSPHGYADEEGTAESSVDEPHPRPAYPVSPSHFKPPEPSFDNGEIVVQAPTGDRQSIAMHYTNEQMASMMKQQIVIGESLW